MSVSSSNSISQTEVNKKEIVNKIKEKYDIYESGAIDFNQLRKIIVKDLQVKETDAFKNLAASAQADNKTFPNLIKSLNILNSNSSKHPSFTPQDIKNSTDQRFHRYAKNKGFPQLKVEEKVKPMPKKHLVDSTQKLVDGKITTKEYKDILKDNGINPQVEEINKHLRIIERGDIVKYNELQFAVNKYKNSEFDPHKVEFVPPKRTNTMKEADKERSIVVAGSNPMYLPKKKTVQNDGNFVSQKDFYDWEENLKKDNSNCDEFRFSKLPFAKKSTVDDIYKEKKVPPYSHNGNILLFGQQPGDPQKLTLKRKDPNERTKSEEYGLKIPKKNNHMFKESTENTLKFG